MKRSVSESTPTVDSALLDKLSEHLGMLAGGSLSIGEFSTWFMNSEWEARMSSSRHALWLGWAIESILFEWGDFPDDISEHDVLSAIHGELSKQGGAFFGPVFGRWDITNLIASLRHPIEEAPSRLSG